MSGYKIVLKNLQKGEFPFCIQRKIHPQLPVVEAHDHDSFELVYVLRGKAEHTLDGFTASVQNGSVILIPPGSRHYYKSERWEEFEIFNMLISPDAFHPLFIEFPGTEFLEKTFSLFYNTPSVYTVNGMDRPFLHQFLLKCP